MLINFLNFFTEIDSLLPKKIEFTSCKYNNTDIIDFSSFTKGSSVITNSSFLFGVDANAAKIIITEYDSYYQIDAIYNDTSSSVGYRITSVNGIPKAFYYYVLPTSKSTFSLPIYSPTVTINIPVPKYSNLKDPSGPETRRNFPVALSKNFFNFPTLPQ